MRISDWSSDVCSSDLLASICRDAFDDPRLELVIADGVDFVSSCAERYDLVLVDSTDPIGPGEVLFSETFYGKAKRCLAPGGILVTQNGVPFLQGEELTSTMRAFRSEEHTSELQSLMRISYAVFCLKKKHKS